MGRTQYVCKKCKYKFSRNSDYKVLRCPYCSNPDSVEEYRADFASKVIDEVSRLEERRSQQKGD